MSDISTINGRSIFDYDDYAEGASAAQKAAFEESAKVPVAGKYDPSSDTVETKTVELSALLGGGGGGGGAGLTPVSVEVVHTSGKCTINVPSNNSFVTVTGLEKYESDAGYGIYITPPTVASGELLNCVVEIIGGDGSDHWINVNGEYGQYLMLASPTSNLLMGFSPAHVTFLGKCYTIVTNGGGS